MARRLCALMRIQGQMRIKALVGQIDNLAAAGRKFLAGLSFHGGDSCQEAILFILSKL
jgi:hypothetical protein